MAYCVYAAMISLQYFHGHRRIRPTYYLPCMLQDLHEYHYSLLGKNLYLICKSLSFGLYTGLPVSKEYNVLCCNT